MLPDVIGGLGGQAFLCRQPARITFLRGVLCVFVCNAVGLV